MQQIQLHPAALEAYHLVLRDVFKTRSGNTDADIQKLQLELTKLIQLRDSLDEKFLMNQLPYEDYDRIKTANKIKFDEMESRLHNLRQFKKNYEEHLTYAIEKLKTIAQDFDNMTAMNKKILLSSIFPEKLEFSEKKFRTPRINSLIGSITAPNLITETARYNLAVLKNDFVSSGVAAHPIFELFVSDITLLNNALRQIAA